MKNSYDNFCPNESCKMRWLKKSIFFLSRYCNNFKIINNEI